MAYNKVLTGAGWVVDPITPAEPPYSPGPGYQKTLTGSGWVVDPIPPKSNVLAAIKAAAAAAPTSQAAISYVAGPVPTLGAVGEQPDWPGGYTRRWISGAGNTGSADLLSVIDIENPSQFLEVPGPVVNNQGDGSQARFWANAQRSDERGNESPIIIAFRHTGRYLSIPGMQWGFVTMKINGAQSNVVTQQTLNKQHVKFDFLTVATRDIIITTLSWVSEILVGAGETITKQPVNPFTSRPRMGVMGDSFMFSSDWPTSKMLMRELIVQMSGGLGYVASVMGGTGYGENAGAPGDAFQDAPRLLPLQRGAPLDVIWSLGGINDQFPGVGVEQVVPAATATINALRPLCKLLVVVGPWAPNQTDGANPGGKYQQIKNALKTILAATPGPWIFIDNLSNSWNTSKGTSFVGAGPWQTGTGKVTAPTGSGNGDIWVSDDGTHPTEAGARGLANCCAAAYQPAVASM